MKHVAETCPICGPFVNRDAYKRGEARARAAMGMPPLENEVIDLDALALKEMER